ncbi:MAG TPA: protein kinase, partial [Microthrixaceae bacterium]|nr:protein kinase [Microthrixaceae bacterium]
MDHLETLEPHALHRLDHYRAPGQGMTLTRDRVGDESVLRKSARGGQRAALRREAEVLRALGGHGVVRLIEIVDGADVTELVVLDTGGPSLAAALADPATDSRSALRLLADACDAVSRLHEQGWAHGDLRADHVLLTRRHHIRLCSLGDAVSLGTEPDGGRADRVALLRIVDDWTRSAGTDGSPMSSRIRSRVLARRTHRLPDDPDPRLLGRILRRTAATGLAVPSRDRIRLPLPLRSGRRVRRVAVPAVTITLVAGIAWFALPFQGPDPGLGGSDSGGGTAHTTQMSTTTTVALGAAPPAPETAAASGCRAVERSRPDVDGDGCGDDVSIEHDVVVAGGHRYRVGRVGDLAAIGDWDCDGTSTIAVLRPEDGTVHVFDRWALDGRPAQAATWGRVDGAATIAAPA